jgi:hypothetical protein
MNKVSRSHRILQSPLTSRAWSHCISYPQGRTEAAKAKIAADALAVEGAGAFAIVVEGTAEPVAREVTAAVSVPTIGIGASPAYDGPREASNEA